MSFSTQDFLISVHFSEPWILTRTNGAYPDPGQGREGASGRKAVCKTHTLLDTTSYRRRASRDFGRCPELNMSIYGWNIFFN